MMTDGQLQDLLAKHLANIDEIVSRNIDRLRDDLDEMSAYTHQHGGYAEVDPSVNSMHTEDPVMAWPGGGGSFIVTAWRRPDQRPDAAFRVQLPDFAPQAARPERLRTAIREQRFGSTDRRLAARKDGHSCGSQSGAITLARGGPGDPSKIVPARTRRRVQLPPAA